MSRNRHIGPCPRGWGAAWMSLEERFGLDVYLHGKRVVEDPSAGVRLP